MSKVEMESKAAVCEGLQTAPPPQYYAQQATIGTPGDAGAGYGTAHTYQPQQQVMYSAGQLVDVKVAPPVQVASGEPIRTTCALVMATCSAILCGFWCGAAAIIFAWKARMQLFKQQYEPARHSLCVTWIFFSLALAFGLIIWGSAIYYLYLVYVIQRSVSSTYGFGV